MTVTPASETHRHAPQTSRFSFPSDNSCGPGAPHPTSNFREDADEAMQIQSTGQARYRHPRFSQAAQIIELQKRQRPAIATPASRRYRAAIQNSKNQVTKTAQGIQPHDDPQRAYRPQEWQNYGHSEPPIRPSRCHRQTGSQVGLHLAGPAPSPYQGFAVTFQFSLG